MFRETLQNSKYQMSKDIYYLRAEFCNLCITSWSTVQELKTLIDVFNLIETATII
jgi:hypothetical protein